MNSFSSVSSEEEGKTSLRKSTRIWLVTFLVTQTLECINIGNTKL